MTAAGLSSGLFAFGIAACALAILRRREAQRAAKVARVRAQLAAETAEHHHWLMWSYECAAWAAADRPMPDVTAQKVTHQ